MINKERFKSFLRYSVFVYLVIIIIVGFSMHFAYDVIHKPKYSEQVNVFVGVFNIDNEKIEKKLYSGYEDGKIKVVNVDNADYTDTYYPVVFTTRGLINTDILIINLENITDDDINSLFAPIDNISEIVSGEFEYYTKDDHKYGIKMNSYLRNYIHYDSKDYYLFINKNSDKMAKFTGEGTDDGLNALTNIFK